MMTEFLHEVVKKREWDAEYRTLRLEPPRIGLPAGLMEAIQRDMERHYTMLADNAVTVQRG
jgi:hypothetical protein